MEPPGKKSMDELFESVIMEAQFVPGDSQVFEEGRQVSWLNMDLAQTGQAFFRKHYASLVFAHALYMGLGFGFKPVTGVVIRTGGFKGLAKTSKRVLSTIWHVMRWYESDIIGCYAPGFKAIGNVRRTHNVIRRKCCRPEINNVDFLDNEQVVEEADPVAMALSIDLSFLDKSTFDRMDLRYDPPVHMSQFAMAMTQISFLLPVFANPEAFGISDLEDAEGFEHLWALIGHLAGIDDRYNIPLQRPGKEFYVKFWKEVFIPSFLVRDPKICAVQDSFFQNSGAYLPQMSVPGSFYYFLKQSTQLQEFSGHELHKLTSISDRVVIFFFWLIFKLVSMSVIFRSCLNFFISKRMKLVLDEVAKEDDAPWVTKLPNDTAWSSKYRKPNKDILHKWRKIVAILAIMRPPKKESSRKIQPSKKYV